MKTGLANIFVTFLKFPLLYYANKRFVIFHDCCMMSTLERVLNLVLFTAAMFVF